MKSRLKLILCGLRLMTRGEIIRSLGIVVLMMVTGFIESAIVALVIPIVYIVVDPTGFSSSAIGKKLGQFVDLHAAENLFAYLAGGFIILLILATATSARSRFLSEKFGSCCVNRLS